MSQFHIPETEKIVLSVNDSPTMEQPMFQWFLREQRCACPGAFHGKSDGALRPRSIRCRHHLPAPL